VRVALVTSERLPLDHWKDIDAVPLGEGLADLGVRVEQTPWEAEPPRPWGHYDALVMQSPWSMWVHQAEFRRWLNGRAAEGCRLLNPADVIRLGSDKRYLRALTAAGVSTVPTVVFEPGTPLDELREGIAASFPRPSAARRTVVVKPISSGGALGLREFPASHAGAAVAHARALHAGGSAALVQPYMSAIDTHRELAVVFLRDRISHAVTKAPVLRPGGALVAASHPDPQPYDLSPAQTDVALRAYKAFLALRQAGSPPVYSIRLDFLIDPPTPPGLLLLEIEAVAPVKFLPMFRRLAPAFARAIVELGV
jgi:glutathione synthase/RimK-type ligase-like ATP-grasp enzyme